MSHQSPPARSSFITVPSLDLNKPQVTDRTHDLDSAIIHSADGGQSVHVSDAELAREWAAAFTQAAELLEARGPDKFCAACGFTLPEHQEQCRRGAK